MVPVLRPQVSLLWFAVLLALTWGQFFQPSFILMTSRTASSFFVANTSNIPVFSAIEVNNSVGLPSPSCSGINHTQDWNLDSNTFATEVRGLRSIDFKDFPGSPNMIKFGKQESTKQIGSF